MIADQISSLFWLVVGGLVIYGSVRLDLGSLREPGSGFLSFLAGLFICLTAGIVFLQSLFWTKAVQPRLKDLWENLRFWRPAAVLLLLLVYILVLRKLGFLLTTFIIFLIVFRGVEKLSWKKSAIISLSMSVLSYLLFYHALKTILPTGIFYF